MLNLASEVVRSQRDEEPFRYCFIRATNTLLAIAMSFFLGGRSE